MSEDTRVLYAKLFFLGSPRIERAGETFEVDTRKAIALLAYLALEGGRHSRDALAALLWPEHGQSKARAALRRTLSALGELRSDGVLISDRESVTLDPGGVWVDANRFQNLLAECKNHGHPDNAVCSACLPLLSEAASLYRGDFLSGFGLRDSFNFDDWQYFQAEALRRELDGALDRLVRIHGARGEWEKAISYARRRLNLDPLSESAHRSLMRAYALSGNRAAALRQYRECVRSLEKELGVAPLEETTQLYRIIEEGERPEPFEMHAVPEEQPPEVAPEDRGSASLLVGRDEELRILSEVYEESGEGRLAILEGEAGIGKTRLAEEFMDIARRRGAVTLAARCYPEEASLAYGPFIEALEPALSRPEAAVRLGNVPARSLGEAARLLPGLSSLFPDLPPVLPLEAPGARSRFFEGTSQVLLAVCGDTPPGILFLDDLQWADEASLDLLAYLVRRLRGRPLLVLATWRGEEVPVGHRLRRLAREAQRTGSATILTLERLDRAAVAELSRSVTGEHDGLHQRLYDETEGLPLFLTEYLAAIANGEIKAESGDWSLPGGVRDLLEARLQTLSETGKQLADAASAIGRSFDFDTVREASGRSEEEAVSALEELISHKLIREIAGGEGSPTYDFSHEKLREYVYEQTSLARKRLLHRRIAAALATRARRIREVGPLAAQISHHYRLAGQEIEAAEYAKLAGEHARALYANTEAISHFQTALALGHPAQATLHEAIGDLYTLAGEYGTALTSYETTAALCEGRSLARVEHKLGNVHARRGEWELAEGHYEAARREYGDSGEELARLYADESLLARNRGNKGEARRLAHRALELAEASGDVQALTQAHNILGIIAGEQDPESSRRHLELSLALSDELEDPGARVAALNNLALALRSNGEIERALELTRTALELCSHIGDRHREAALHNNLADLLHDAGHREDSMAHLEQAVKIFAEIGEEGELQPEIWKLVEW